MNRCRRCCCRRVRSRVTTVPRARHIRRKTGRRCFVNDNYHYPSVRDDESTARSRVTSQGAHQGLRGSRQTGTNPSTNSPAVFLVFYTPLFFDLSWIRLFPPRLLSVTRLLVWFNRRPLVSGASRTIVYIHSICPVCMSFPLMCMYLTNDMSGISGFNFMPWICVHI